MSIKQKLTLRKFFLFDLFTFFVPKTIMTENVINFVSFIYITAAKICEQKKKKIRTILLH